MRKVQVINGQIAQVILPITGTLKDGRTVSGYHLLDEEILKEEGWLPLEDNPPEYDNETHYLISDGYDVLIDKVVAKYRVETIPEPQPTETELLQKEIALLQAKTQANSDVTDFHEELIVELAMMLYQ